jgi:hypothetical protein
MKIIRVSRGGLYKALAMAWVLLLLQPFNAPAELEQTFDVLQVGTTMYRNVTVTTKSKNYIFLLHSKGMTSVKVSDLSADLRTQLGYVVPPPPQAKTNTPTAWARETLNKIEAPQVRQIEAGLHGLFQRGPSGGLRLESLSRNFILLLCGGLAALFLFHSYCCLLMCRKAGTEPGGLIWVPLVQLLPLLKAAGMSPWWFFGFLVPGVNLVTSIIWCINITRARDKHLFIALLLILPITSPFAVLYLAFSGRPPRPTKENRRIEVMALETA